MNTLTVMPATFRPSLRSASLLVSSIFVSLKVRTSLFFLHLQLCMHVNLPFFKKKNHLLLFQELEINGLFQ